ncbi:MAG: tetratricopeptide repeat protein [candidate division Zixibacteria bacterium]|nr:tetratricopeptide repeat protein [candidate division Zixibacteria bacterium]
MEKRNFDIASEYFEKVLRVNNLYGFREALAKSYHKAGRIDDALEIYEELINRYPQNRAYWPAFSVLIHFDLAQVYEDAGRFDDAIKQYEIFLDIWRNADDGIKRIEDAKERLAKLKS